MYASPARFSITFTWPSTSIHVPVWFAVGSAGFSGSGMSFPASASPQKSQGCLPGSVPVRSRRSVSVIPSQAQSIWRSVGESVTPSASTCWKSSSSRGCGRPRWSRYRRVCSDERSNGRSSGKTSDFSFAYAAWFVYSGFARSSAADRNDWRVGSSWSLAPALNTE